MDGMDRTSSMPRSVLRSSIGKDQAGILVDTVCVLPVQWKCRQELKNTGETGDINTYTFALSKGKKLSLDQPHLKSKGIQLWEKGLPIDENFT